VVQGESSLLELSRFSRNRNFGEKIGKGEAPDNIIANSKMIVEGYINTLAFYNLTNQKNIEAPLTNAVYKVLYKKLSPINAVKELMKRKLKIEIY
jgi:glycerol-3-phosphate dehydrogenase (NAD(P)+)